MEALVVSLPPEPPLLGHHLDFWRIEPSRLFYQLRGLEDDLNELGGIPSRRVLDFFLQIARTAEVIAIALYLARQLGCKEDETTLLCRFRWTKLSGRSLASWVEPRRMLSRNDTATEDDYVSPVIAVPLETPPAGIAPHVQGVVSGLFRLFDGREFAASVIDEIVDRTVEGRL